LISIPAKLFSNNTKVTTFESAFNDCQKLSAIPATLLANCPEISNVNWMFHGCNALKSIPVSIFDHNRRIVSFEYTFSSCYNLEYNKQETPYTRIGDRKYHLYERAYDEDNFVAPLRYQSCFEGDRYRDRIKIPKSWGGNGNDNNYKGDSQGSEDYGYDKWN
jgi:hypothetical protein